MDTVNPEHNFAAMNVAATAPGTLAGGSFVGTAMYPAASVAPNSGGNTN